MKSRLVFPGTFSPPTYGHAELATRAYHKYGNLTVVCSTNETKNAPLFTPEEAVNLWQAYRLPSGIDILTLADFLGSKPETQDLTMVRGIRDAHDLEYERQVAIYNHQQFGISSFLYLWADTNLQDISSTVARENAQAGQLQPLAHLTAPRVTAELLERTHKLRRLFLVVGKPGAGKSTLLSQYASKEAGVVHINTDEINTELVPLLRQHFGSSDLVQLALERGSELRSVIGEQWLRILGNRIKSAPPNSCVFVEAAYGLQPEISLFRFVGSRVILVDCGSEAECQRRIVARGTPQHLSFVATIPNLTASRRIARANDLQLWHVRTKGSNSSLATALAQLKLIVDGGCNERSLV